MLNRFFIKVLIFFWYKCFKEEICGIYVLGNVLYIKYDFFVRKGELKWYWFFNCGVVVWCLIESIILVKNFSEWILSSVIYRYKIF